MCYILYNELYPRMYFRTYSGYSGICICWYTQRKCFLRSNTQETVHTHFSPWLHELWLLRGHSENTQAVGLVMNNGWHCSWKQRLSNSKGKLRVKFKRKTGIPSILNNYIWKKKYSNPSMKYCQTTTCSMKQVMKRVFVNTYFD